MGMNPTLIRQKVRIPAPPSAVYSALMDSKRHTAITGAPARIEKKVGGRFSAYDGYASGVNVELVPGKRIVQSWRASDFPKGTHSLIVIELSSKKGGKETELSFEHLGVPRAQQKHLGKGWKDFYWEPLRKYFGA
jgi:uncharacterized protein YndB with AHSA1/START domain